MILLNICNKCGTELEEEDLINGCPKCGSKLFKFINTKHTSDKKLKSETTDLNKNSKQKNSIESVKIEGKGIYELNLQQLFDGEINVFSDKEGNYVIDIYSLLNKNAKIEEEKDSKK